MTSKPITIFWIRTGSDPLGGNKTGFNVIVFNFDIRGKLFINNAINKYYYSKYKGLELLLYSKKRLTKYNNFMRQN